ncbi:MAG: tricarballylate utilization 4Fe-4S protein TcuB [Geminicoccaceae bacterium]|nr:tricarballylate utilization 4Fe-4S protein TcuB [Geminicoccaceae bacterium]MCB9943039.1 tricarballylate utilization 4Fe-4S protein TcuB [Geminicoccaceae bacterium]
MSLDVTLQTDPGAISADPVEEARRQVEICNACRYCEGYCSVFPAITRKKIFTDGDITQLANLCHNCRGCYYACQYTAPHEFDLNLPRALAAARAQSWERMVWPQALARLFQARGGAIATALVIASALMFLAIATLPGSGSGFYAWLGHGAMVAIFLPAFILPLVAVGVGLRRYWKEVDGGHLTLGAFLDAAISAGRMKNLSGGQGQGCNFEKGERYSDARRHAHQAVLYGFLLCFASTTSATILHYGFNAPAPYPFWSLPKLLGVAGGLLLVAGCLGLEILRRKADPQLGTPRRAAGERAFVLLLGYVGLSGLLLYAVRGTGLTGLLLALHLGGVLTFFLLTPYTKMAHGFFRLTALVQDAVARKHS